MQNRYLARLFTSRHTYARFAQLDTRILFRTSSILVAAPQIHYILKSLWPGQMFRSLIQYLIAIWS